MQERKQFLRDWEVDARVGRVNLAALCRAYGVSRPTAYKWIGRYLEAHGRALKLVVRVPGGLREVGDPGAVKRMHDGLSRKKAGTPSRAGL